MHKAALDAATCVCLSEWTEVFISVGRVPRSGTVGLEHKHKLSENGQHYRPFQNACTILHAHWPWSSIPVAPHPHQHSNVSLVDVEQHLVVALACVFLMIQDWSALSHLFVGHEVTGSTTGEAQSITPPLPSSQQPSAPT